MKSGVSVKVPQANKAIVATVAVGVALAFGLSGCGTTTVSRHAKPQIDPKLGVAPSPKVVADGQPVPKGGGRAMLGQPYKIAGKTYTPRIDPSYKAVGLASWYGTAFHGRRTANGEVFDSASISAAHPTMPLPSYARLTSLNTGRSVIVRVNDRGPYHSNRVLDMSQRAAEMLGVKRAGVAKIKVEYVGPAPLEGDDTPFLMASYRGPAFEQPVDDKPNIMLAAVEAIPGVKTVFGALGSVGHRSEPAPAPAAAPIQVADASAMPGVPAPAFNVLPPDRPVEVYDYVSIASADPARYQSGNMVAVASVAQPVEPLSFGPTTAATTASFGPTATALPVSFSPTALPVERPVVMFGDTRLPPLPPQISSYAAERVASAYDAFDSVSDGVGLSELTHRLGGAAADEKVASGGPVIQLGVFGNIDNVARLSASLGAFGTVAVTDVTIGDKPMHLVRLGALTSTPDAALDAATRAGVTGARLVR
jgi:rare lipoprotein A